jgi:hypothetical protein
MILENFESVNIRVMKKYNQYDPVTTKTMSLFFLNSSLAIKNALINNVYLLNQSLI